MSGPTTSEFTPWRENGFVATVAPHAAYDESGDKEYGIPFEMFAEYFDFKEWRNSIIVRAREADRDSRAQLILRPKTTPNFKLYGRHFFRVFAMDDYVSHAGLDGKVKRGGAIGVKPDPEWRKFLKEWQKIQWAREDLYEEPHEWGGGEDVPLRAVLGGKRVFTPCHGVKTKRTAIGTATYGN